MKNYSLLLLYFLNTTVNLSAGDFHRTVPSKPALCFTENKGQISDQNNNRRQDVLYSGTDGELTVHIRNTGISYQLYRGDSLSESKSKNPNDRMLETNRQTVYRVDVDWLGINKAYSVITNGVLSGYDNYYSIACQKGATKVRSFKGITFKNLYAGIDLHYHEKNGHLKYDFIVCPNADFKIIRLFVKGAKIKEKADGGLLLNTPMGDIEEGRPIVFQGGRELEAKWKVRGDTLSYEIKNYDPTLELIIDPGTRLWGTYYGGFSHDYGFGCTTDLAGNVYMAGFTQSPSGTVIATSGAYQTTITVNDHAFLVKFNSLGVRLWGTYYGGNASDGAYSCATDAIGNVFITGITLSNSLATIGAHQTINAGGQDAFLVKFDSSGIRQWCTYYGSSNAEYGSSCATDGGGNVYMGGTGQPSTGTIIATPGSHQATFGGGSTDAFLAKFDPNGTRLWATYYGGIGQESCKSVALDLSGNIFMAGGCDTSGPIATTGAFQSSFGGVADAILIKFNSSGQRLWGSYYGGLGNDFGYACATDGSGNIYLSGACTSTSGISTTGAHQINYAGGPYDAFLVKFDSSGLRLWGTYYGSSGTTYGYACTTDNNGNIYMTGVTTSTSGVSTSGAFQSVFGGNCDAFLVKFSNTGARLVGTYYGGSIGADYGYSCASDATGDVYMTGQTASAGGTVISSVGAHQAIAGGNNDAYLVKFKNCPVIGPTVTVSNPVCNGTTVSFSTSISGTTSLNYSWTGPNSFTANGLSPSIINAQAGDSGSYYLKADDGFGCFAIIAISLTINPSPTITVNSGSICNGQNFTLIPNGASTFTFLNGGPVVTPIVNTVYSVTGTSAEGCISGNTATSNVMVNSLPMVSAISSNDVICVGNSATLQALGAVYYLWSTGSNNSSIMVNPISTTVYSVTGVDLNGCANTSIITQTVDACTGLHNNEQTSSNGIIYPNPNKGEFKLETESEGDVILFNNLGQEVFRSHYLPGSHMVILSHLEQGVYQGRIFISNNKVESFRVIVLE